MTFEEALKVFGLSEKPDPEKLNALFKAMQKIAFIKGNEREAKQLNIARDVLLGRQAEQSIPQADKSGVHGHATALCSNKDVPFILDWNFLPDQDNGDEIVFSNPHSLFAPERIDRAIKKLRSGHFLKHLFRKNDNDETWASGFQARLVLTNVGCLHCDAKHLRWCEKCNSIFCRPSKEELYPKQFFNCPTCKTEYGWGEGFSGKAKKEFDAKDLRSIGFGRKALTNGSLKMIGKGG